MTRRVYLLLALLALPFGIAAQAPKTATPSEPALEIILPADSARAKEAPVVRSVRMLSDRTTRELLFSGFPARLHFRLELWKANRFFDDLVRTIEWDVVVSYDPLARHYTVTRIAGRWQSLGTFADLKDAEDAVARPFVPGIQPPTGHSKHYYYASLDLEMLSVHDIDEVKRWLRRRRGLRHEGPRESGHRARTWREHAGHAAAGRADAHVPCAECGVPAAVAAGVIRREGSSRRACDAGDAPALPPGGASRGRRRA